MEFIKVEGLGKLDVDKKENPKCEEENSAGFYHRAEIGHFIVRGIHRSL